MRDETALAIVGIVAVACLQAVATFTGQDGTTFPMSIGAILTIAGAASAYVIATKPPGGTG